MTAPPGGLVTRTWEITRLEPGSDREQRPLRGHAHHAAIQQSQLTAGGDAPRVRLDRPLPASRRDRSGHGRPAPLRTSTVERSDFDDRDYLEAFDLADAAVIHPASGVGPIRAGRDRRRKPRRSARRLARRVDLRRLVRRRGEGSPLGLRTAGRPWRRWTGSAGPPARVAAAGAGPPDRPAGHPAHPGQDDHRQLPAWVASVTAGVPGPARGRRASRPHWWSVGLVIFVSSPSARSSSWARTGSRSRSAPCSS